MSMTPSQERDLFTAVEVLVTEALILIPRLVPPYQDNLRGAVNDVRSALKRAHEGTP